MKRYRVQFYLEDDVAAWFEGQRDKGETVALALTICCRLEKLREMLDGMMPQSPGGNNITKSQNTSRAAQKAATLVSNMFRLFDGDSDQIERRASQAHAPEGDRIWSSG